MRPEYHLLVADTSPRPLHRIFRVSNERELYAVRRLHACAQEEIPGVEVFLRQIPAEAASRYAPGRFCMTHHGYPRMAYARCAYVRFEPIGSERSPRAPAFQRTRYRRHYAPFFPPLSVEQALQQDGDVDYALPARLLVLLVEGGRPLLPVLQNDASWDKPLHRHQLLPFT